MTNQSETKIHIFYLVASKKKKNKLSTKARINITLSHTRLLTPTHTHLFSAKFFVNFIHKHDNDRNLKGVYCYAYLLDEMPRISCLEQSSSNSAYTFLSPLEPNLSHECRLVQINDLISL